MLRVRIPKNDPRQRMRALELKRHAERLSGEADRLYDLANAIQVRRKNMVKQNSIPLYRDGRQYDALNSFLVADIPFFVEEAKRAAGPVLELACGTGRLAIPIVQSGVEIVGLDLSPSMLAHARTKAKAAGV